MASLNLCEDIGHELVIHDTLRCYLYIFYNMHLFDRSFIHLNFVWLPININCIHIIIYN